MTTRHVAQINVARFRVAKDDPVNAPFMAALDHVNAMADASDGFIWRLVGDGNDATDVEVIPGDPDFIVNMSVWRDIASLEAFAYRQPDHRKVLSQRAEWFDVMEPSFCLWWVPVGHIPTVEEGIAMLARLKAEGAGDEVFTFASWKASRAGRG
ncbi:DUF3291 domain-containing protein [Sphingomonas lacunae]|uniref:DUF3291 domain-containing protein n=1 Tax=Sphingomonas lacunae TaxID=2698828 RepID=A0A6M4AZN1_9SPHN|nr:DUF3291 domain-containing protein [Sphingomonas lacunae]QJQ32501.1 DUF3291 domain-containing protein [Sphingomonas lacunae]